MTDSELDAAVMLQVQYGVNLERLDELLAERRERNRKMFTSEIVRLRYVKGWPEAAPKPYRLYFNGKYVTSFANMVTMERYVEKQLDNPK